MNTFREVVMYLCVIIVISILSVRVYLLEKKLKEDEQQYMENVISQKKDRDAFINSISDYLPNFSTVWTLERNTKRPIDLSKTYYIFIDYSYSKKEAEERIAELVKEDKHNLVV